MKKISFLVLILFLFGATSVVYSIKMEHDNAANLVQLAKNNPDYLKLYPELADENYRLKKIDTVNFFFQNLNSGILITFPYIIIFIITGFASSSLFKLMKSKIIRLCISSYFVFRNNVPSIIIL